MDTTPPPTPAQPQPPPASTGPAAPPKLNLSLDLRTVETMKASALWNAVSRAISAVAAHLSLFFIGGFFGQFFSNFGSIARDFPVGDFIKNIFWGAVYGAVIGFCISKYFARIQQWNRLYLKGRLNTFYKLMFYPSVFIALIFFAMTSVVSFVIGIMPLVIIGVGIILSSYVYAKMMEKKVGSLYPPAA